MTTELQKEISKFEMIKVWLPLAIAIAGAIFTWGVFSQRITASETRLTATESKQEELTNTLTDVRVDVASIKSDVSFIKDRVR